jgi:hypothetical protein
MDEQGPKETEGREPYYDAALAATVLICDSCGASLDPDEDLGSDVTLKTDGWYVLLGDEAFRRGWKIVASDGEAICPNCAQKSES